jgi:uncharacterized phosphosugar-binding protein
LKLTRFRLTIVGVFIINAVMADAVDRLTDRGIAVYVS